MSDPEQPVEAILELISFEIAGQELCVDIRNVREIRGWTPATPIPQTPDYICGVINMRGAVVPVVDLRNRLGLGVTEPTSRHVLLIVHDGERVAGLLVDGVQETFQVAADLVQPAPMAASVAADRFVDGILLLGERLLSRLVVSALLAQSNLDAALSQADQQPA